MKLVRTRFWKGRRAYGFHTPSRFSASASCHAPVDVASTSTGQRELNVKKTGPCKTQGKTQEIHPLAVDSSPGLWPKQLCVASQQGLTRNRTALRIAAVTKLAISLLFTIGCHPSTDNTSVAHSSPETHATPQILTVLTAASTSAVLKQVAQAFEHQTSAAATHDSPPQIRVVLSPGPSNSLARQILAGAQADIFLSANPRWAEAVEQAGLASAAVNLLGNQLVLAVPHSNPAGIQAPADLLQSPNTRVAIAGQRVPAGLYARQALQNLGLWQELFANGNVIHGSDARVTLAYIERGEVDAGLIYATDAQRSTRVHVVTELPVELYDPIVYRLVRLRDTQHPGAADRFFQFLQSDQARVLFEEAGFQVKPSAPD